MTDREREFLNLGFEYAEGIEQCDIIEVPATGKKIYKNIRRLVDDNGQQFDKVFWETQAWNDTYWGIFEDVLAAAKFATPQKPNLAVNCLAEIIQFVDNYEEFTGENTENYAWRQGVVHGEQLLADSIKNIINGHFKHNSHKAISLAASERVN